MSKNKFVECLILCSIFLAVMFILIKLLPEDWISSTEETVAPVRKKVETDIKDFQRSVHEKMEALGPKYQLTEYPTEGGRIAYKLSQECRNGEYPSRDYYICIEEGGRTALFLETKDTTSEYGGVSRIITDITEQERKMLTEEIKEDLKAAYDSIENIWNEHAESSVLMKEGLMDTYHSNDFISVDEEFESYCLNGVI